MVRPSRLFWFLWSPQQAMQQPLLLHHLLPPHRRQACYYYFFVRFKKLICLLLAAESATAPSAAAPQPATSQSASSAAAKQPVVPKSVVAPGKAHEPRPSRPHSISVSVSDKPNLSQTVTTDDGQVRIPFAKAAPPMLTLHMKFCRNTMFQRKSTLCDQATLGTFLARLTTELIAMRIWRSWTMQCKHTPSVVTRNGLQLFGKALVVVWLCWILKRYRCELVLHSS